MLKTTLAVLAAAAALAAADTQFLSTWRAPGSEPIDFSGRKVAAEADTPFRRDKDPLVKRETLELVRGYYKISDRRIRKQIFEMVKAVGRSQSNGAATPKRTYSAGPSRRRAQSARRH